MNHYAKILWQRPRFLYIDDNPGEAPPYHLLLLSLRTLLPLYGRRPAPVERGVLARRQTFSPHPPSQ